jgi:ATP-binding cassette subfamily F protein 3
LRSVCDSLLIVHDNFVDQFDQSLDDYPAWLRDREQAAGATQADQRTTATVSKKEIRQREAQRRATLKPLLDQVRKVESQLARQRSALAAVEGKLGDEALYSDPQRKDEWSALIREQTALAATVSALEDDWLAASEAVEAAGEMVNT